LRSGIKVVLCFLTISALLGFTQVPIAEGAVIWNGFLKQVGFDPPSVYEVSDSTVIPAGETENETLTLLCDTGDWMDNTDNINFVSSPPVFVAGVSSVHDTNAMFILDPASLATTGIPLSKRIGYSVLPQILNNAEPFNFPVTVTVTILCISPSSMMTVGGEWQATDTTALIIGYSVLNAYWLAPIGIGIGVGIYLVNRSLTKEEYDKHLQKEKTHFQEDLYRENLTLNNSSALDYVLNHFKKK